MEYAEENKDNKSISVTEKEKIELNPEEIRNHFRELWSTDPDIFISLFPMLKNKTSKYPTDLFFIETLAVPPPKTRPCQYMSGKNYAAKSHYVFTILFLNFLYVVCIILILISRIFFQIQA